MKKVRYAIGALGVLPAAGLFVPTATAAATQLPATTGKSVRLPHRTTVAATCNARHSKSSSYYVRGYISYSRDNGCIGFVEGHLYHDSRSGTQMRVRFYDSGSQTGPTLYVNGTIHYNHSSNSYKSTPFMTSIQQVCEAIVWNSTHKVLSGTKAMCEQTGFQRP